MTHLRPMSAYQAGRLANALHDAIRSKRLPASQGLAMLRKLEGSMSMTQLHKLADLEYAVQHNPELFA